MDKDKHINHLIGKKMKTIREQHNLTLNEVAQYFDVTPQNIHKREKGEVSISVKELCLFMQIFEISLKEFFKDIGNAKPEDTPIYYK